MSRDATVWNDRDVWEPGRQGRATTAQPPPESSAHPPAPAGSAPACPGFSPASDHFADQLRETAGAIFMYASMASIFQQMSTYAFKSYRDKLVADCGNPTDPIEIMMIEQIALAHMNIGRLQFRSATAVTVESARAYGGMATQLMGEFRRTVLGLKSYRTRLQTGAVDEGMSSPTAVASPDGEATRKGANGELGSEPGKQDHDDGTIPLPESPAGRGRETELGEAARVHARRA